MELLFLDLDFNAAENFCARDKNQPFKTELKRQGLEKLERWYYFFKVLKDNPEYKEYLTRNLRNYSVKSLEYAVLFLMVSEPDSEDEKRGYDVLYGMLQNTKKKSIEETSRKIQKALEYCGKTFKTLPAKEEQKKE